MSSPTCSPGRCARNAAPEREPAAPDSARPSPRFASSRGPAAKRRARRPRWRYRRAGQGRAHQFPRLPAAPRRAHPFPLHRRTPLWRGGAGAVRFGAGGGRTRRAAVFARRKAGPRPALGRRRGQDPSHQCRVRRYSAGDVVFQPCRAVLLVRARAPVPVRPIHLARPADRAGDPRLCADRDRPCRAGL